MIDAPRVVGDSVAYEYLELVLNPRYGTTAVAEPLADRAAASVWRAPGRV